MPEMHTLISQVAVLREEPTPALRWVRGYANVLQQRWAIIIYNNGEQTTVRYEWRDVPTVDDPAP